MLRRFAPLIAAIALAACASTPTYTPAATPTGAGFSETQVEGNRYFVTYRASSSANAALISDYALLRAADLTLAQGKDWFYVDRRTVDEREGGGPSLGLSLGGGNFGSHTAVGASVGFNIPIGNSGPRASSATLEIRLGEGPKPDDPSTYDAHAVSASLRSRLMPHG